MRKWEPRLKQWIIDGAAAVMIGAAVYFISHSYARAEAGLISTGFAIGSGILWALSARLSRRLRRFAATLNFSAACLAAMSAICLLP